MRHLRSCSVAALAICLFAGPAGAGFTTFESGQVRPLALSQSPSGTRLLAVNTPAARLEIFDVTAGGLVHVVSVPVGLEPVAVAVRTLPNGDVEAWVVNHLSDSVSIVRLDPTNAAMAHVVRTLLVGDEPRDIVFAGAAGDRVFVTTAHRGQNAADQGFGPELTTPGVGRADVWVFDADDLGASLWGTPLARVVLFADTPRALAVSPDGATVYAAAFHSGNQTASVSEGAVCDGGAAVAPCTLDDGTTMPGGMPLPNDNFEHVAAPETGLIVKFDPGSGEWRDVVGRNWNPAVKFDLPDLDVFALDADGTPPVQTASWASVGTVLFNLAVNPQSGRVYVTNSDAHNEVRFEGPGIYGGSSVRGHLAEARITVLDGASVLPRHLNKHIPYGTVPSPPGVKANSLATPLGMAITSDGATLYVAAFGSSKIGRFATASLEDDSFVPSAASHITLSGGGPSGLVLDEANGRLYVLTRFDNAVAVVDTVLQQEIASVPIYTPEPAKVVAGRPFLYDAAFTSSNGEASCASCHIFGDFDSLAWDLGNPDAVVVPDNPNPLRTGDPSNIVPNRFHPLKGPMTTQSLRGMANHGPMHWRGDRTGGSTPGGDPLDESAAFKAFNGAFPDLLGRTSPLTTAEMQAFTDFILQVKYPPNPIRSLASGDTLDQAAGRDFFLNSSPSDILTTCDGCHRLDKDAGFFGSAGLSSFEMEPQFFKIPHLRNLYQKVGMFGMPYTPFVDRLNGSPTNEHMGPQVRGFGYLHDGSFDTVLRFLNSRAFAQTFINPGGFERGAAGDPTRRKVEAFLLAFDTDLRPAVGQQITLSATSPAAVVSRINTLQNGCGALVVKGIVAGERRGWVYLGQNYRSDRFSEPAFSTSALQAIASVSGQELTFTCAPPDDFVRLGVDADDDGLFDRDELDDGTDPEDPASGPPPPMLVAAQKLLIKNVLPDVPAKNLITFGAKDAAITTPAPGTPSDPRCAGPRPLTTTLTFRSTTSGQSYSVPLPCYDWTTIGPPATPLGYKFKNSNDVILSTVRTVLWRNGQLKVKVKSPFASLTIGYDLQVGVSQGAVDVEFASGPSRVCMRCAPPTFDGRDGKKFSARSLDCPAPVACPTD